MVESVKDSTRIVVYPLQERLQMCNGNKNVFDLYTLGQQAALVSASYAFIFLGSRNDMKKNFFNIAADGFTGIETDTVGNN